RPARRRHPRTGPTPAAVRPTGPAPPAVVASGTGVAPTVQRQEELHVADREHAPDVLRGDDRDVRPDQPAAVDEALHAGRREELDSRQIEGLDAWVVL